MVVHSEQAFEFGSPRCQSDTLYHTGSAGAMENVHSNSRIPGAFSCTVDCLLSYLGVLGQVAVKEALRLSN